ncbi:hypothetical protein Tsubulata_033740, partial [Turnera subulata]
KSTGRLISSTMENPNPKLNPRVYFDMTIDEVMIGRMVMELDTHEKGVGKFTKPLHFKGTRFYQCGSDKVENDGTGGESISGEDFYSEEAVTKFRVNGWHSSRFFITFVKASWMNGQYPLFGQVMEGLDLLDEIEAAANEYGRMVKEVVIVDC